MNVMNTAEQIGANLVARRKALRLSQATLAARIGLSQNRLSELENSPGTLTLDQLLALLKALGLSMNVDLAPSNPRSRVEW
jgi:HTH-type transcriptional regulator/antitoxin HipB